MPPKLAVLVLLCLPAALVAVDFATGALGAQPVDEAIHAIGNWTLRLLLLALAVTPASRLLHWPRIMQFRRMIGVAAFAYAAAHLSLYAADQAFDLSKVASEIVLRFYLTLGFCAFLILAALAATSTDGMARSLGGRRWRRLHRLAYGAALLGVVHFFLQTKAGPDEPWVMAGLFAWLMLWRAAGWLRKSPGRLADGLPAALAVLAAVATALGESAYYWIKLGVPPESVLAAHLTPELFPRPAMVVAAVCLPLALAPLARRIARRPAPA